MWHPGRRLLGGTWLAVALIVGACDDTEQVADNGKEAPSRPSDGSSAKPADGSRGEPADAGTRPVPDAEAEPELDAGMPAEPDAHTRRDASIDAGGPHDAGSPHDAAVLPFVCNVPAPASCPTPAPRYPEIAAIIKERCSSCHSPLWTGPWPLDTYGHVADWQDTIQSNLLDCTMPPPEAGVPITVEERVSILSWIRCGLPQ
jgi:hypothetical protein